MAATGFFHHIGTLLLFIALVLLIVTCITAPAVHDLAIMKVVLGNWTGSEHSTVNFGSFGYCITDEANGGHTCSKSMIGYSPSAVMNAIENTQFSTSAIDATNDLTKVMVLHPVAAGLAFIAFLLALGAGVVGSLFAALVSVLTFLVTAVVLICDFVLFNVVKNDVNSDGSGSDASFSVGIWTVLVAGICALLGSIIVFLSCCSARLHRNHTATSKVDGGYNNNNNNGATAPRRRRWF
jgi:hypothetical protein